MTLPPSVIHAKTALLPQGWAQGAVNNGTADLTIDPDQGDGPD